MPDHQEVYADANSDQSIIIEINERQDVPDEECGRVFWSDLVRDGGAQAGDIIGPCKQLTPDACPLLPAPLYKCMLVGEQQVAKYKDAACNTVLIRMAVIRLPEHAADLVLTMNAPKIIAAKSSTAGASLRGDEEADSLVFDTLLRSFNVVDWGLF